MTKIKRMTNYNTGDLIRIDYNERGFVYGRIDYISPDYVLVKIIYDTDTTRQKFEYGLIITINKYQFNDMSINLVTEEEKEMLMIETL